MPRRSEAAPGTQVDRLLADAERHLRLGSPAELAGALTRSHLADFSCVGWYGAVPAGWTLVIDAEFADAPPPPELVARFGSERFWERWTRTECLCKLADRPMLAWWPEYGLDVPAGFTGRYRTLRLETADSGGLIVSVACDTETDTETDAVSDAVTDTDRES